MRPEMKVWTSKYLNNIIEQDHRRIKQRIYPMLGFRNFKYATVTISGIELAHQMRKQQFNSSAVTSRPGMSVAQILEGVLTA